MTKRISDLPSDELKADLQKAIELSKLTDELESKYEKLSLISHTLYGVKENILKELGRRSFINEK